ncbi:iron chelate uptake ABC transporter family permease subunit [Micromonospora sp. WMMD1076]|uniref:FecCD family ABC transporter permease n=1 Tax=Micromonospora TaxID=1873 RepID=UPI00249B6AAF|nr:iron chelate uptake ABC transporter family permease subunit [Micromonospora sp. WMMD1076]WFF08040.1 iron chelate uptake ABC transporter family permease subunit [Micromonospora sp. WMMD1076]
MPDTRTRRAAALTTGLVVLAAALAGAALLSLAVGAQHVPLDVVLRALVHPDNTARDSLIVTEVRVPRTLIGLLAGVALGLAGAIVQAVTRNPLADPGILGVNAGAGLFVVVGISLFGVTSLTGYVWFGFAGAAAAAVIVYTIGSMGRGGATPVKLAIAGTALTATLLSFTTAVLVVDVATYDQFRFWRVGSLSGRGLDVAAQGLPFLLVGVVVALAATRSLNALALGDEMATSLGQHVGRARLVAAAAVVVLCGTATAMAGPLVFVGLVVPHIARLVTGPDHRWLLPYSMLLAPLLLLVADVLGRVVARPGEVQVGVVTAIVGAPFFVALARRRRLAEL